MNMSLQEDILDFLFDGAVPVEILKMDDASEVHINSALERKQLKRKKRDAQIGLANNAFGATAGAFATKLAFDEGKRGYDVARGKTPKPKRVTIPERALNKLNLSRKKSAVALGGIAVGSQALNAVLDAQSAQYFARELAPKKKVQDIHKSSDLEWTGEISKVVDEKKQVFGWCSVSKVDGQDVIDRQGDYIPVDEMEASAYDYVLHSRKGGDMHARDGEHPLHKSDMIESFVVTPEKLAKMGLPEDALPHGWWVGFKVNDDTLWEEVKTGKKTHFSVHGRGTRVPMEV